MVSTSIKAAIARVIIAGYLTVQHGDSLATAAARVGSGLLQALRTPDAQPPTQGREAPAAAHDATVAGSAADAPGIVPSEASPAAGDRSPVSAGTGNLEARWAAFAQAPPQPRRDREFPWRHCFRRAAASHEVPESLLLAVASGESAFDPVARSAQDAVGLMQIRWPQTARHLGIRREAELYDPCRNVDSGARYLRELQQRYDGDLHRVLAAYNYGPARIGSGAVPDAARRYSRYIYRHLQRVTGGEADIADNRVARQSVRASGSLVLMRFHHAQRARDYLAFLSARLPELDLRQQREALGQEIVALHYRDPEERVQALGALRGSGLVALASAASPVETKQEATP